MYLKWRWARVIAKSYFPYMLWCLEDREQRQICTVDWTNTNEGLTHNLTCLMPHGSPPTTTNIPVSLGQKAWKHSEQSRKHSEGILISVFFCLGGTGEAFLSL